MRDPMPSCIVRQERDLDTPIVVVIFRMEKKSSTELCKDGVGRPGKDVVRAEVSSRRREMT